MSLRRRCAAAPPLKGGSGAVRPAQLAEADFDSCHSFAALFEHCESHTARSHRVNVTLHENLSCSSSCCRTARTTHNSPACDTGVHDAMRVIRLGRNSGNSSKSRGDTEAGGHRFCVPGETKSLSTSTRTGVRRSAVYGSAHTQQTPLKLHVETWEGLLRNQGPKIFREVEIVSGCAVRVACPSCPDYFPEPPKPGRIIRNMLGWSQIEKTIRSGVWLFRGALQGENLFSSLAVSGDWVRKGSYHTAWAVPCDSSCTCSYSSGQGPAIGPHTGRRCWPLLEGVWRAIAPLMRPWCAEEEVPTAANLNLYRGWKSCVGWHCDDESLFGDAKLIVSVSLGSSAVFRWRRQSCPDDEGHLCWLGHGDIIVMDGQCQDEFLHRTDPGLEQERIDVTFRWIKQHVATCPFLRTGVACCLPTCAQGCSFLVMGDFGVWVGIFSVLWFLLGVLCTWRVLPLLGSLLCTGLGFFRCASYWTRPLGGRRLGHYLF